METILHYLIQEKLLFYIVTVLFAIMLFKIKMNFWWKLFNVFAFAIYNIFTMYFIFSNIYQDNGIRVSILISLVMLIHLAFLAIVNVTWRK